MAGWRRSWPGIVAVVLGWAARGAAGQEVPDAAAMAARIDAVLAAGWVEAGIEPAPAADDAEFLRRVTLDLTGTIPTVHEVRKFLADDAPDKRAAAIGRLLERPRHHVHLAAVWRQTLLPEGADPQVRAAGLALENWLVQQFSRRVPYDQLVGELLTASGNVAQSGPVAFYTAVQLKPEEITANVSRALLGVQLDCAQCHDHPFAAWTRNDFWGMAAFFARVAPPQEGPQNLFQVMDRPDGEVFFPDTQEAVAPRYLGGASAEPRSDLTRRQQLAVWLTAADNPYFARATVNRAWAMLFGRGLVEPVDDLGSQDTAAQPALLDELAEWFVRGGYDLAELQRALALSRAYQLTSAGATGDEAEEALFARMRLKPLSAEQLYDCLAEATRRRLTAAPGMGMAAGRFNDPGRQEFLARFDAPAGGGELQFGIPQALSLMNGRVVAQATDLAGSDLLAALEAPWLSDADRLEILFLSTLSRLPREAERERLIEYVRSGGPTGQPRRALADVLWALINSGEFLLNH